MRSEKLWLQQLSLELVHLMVITVIAGFAIIIIVGVCLIGQK